MTTGLWSLLVVGSSLAGGLVAATLSLQVVLLLLLGGATCFWLGRLDGWQRSYVLTLALMTAATTSLPGVSELAFYPRYLALTLLVTWTAVGSGERRRLRDLPRPSKRLLQVLWTTVGVAGASTAWSISPALTGQQVIALGMLIAVVHFLITRRWLDRSRVEDDLSASFVFFSAVFAAGILADRLGAAGTRSMFGRFQGLYDNPNTLGMVAALCIPLGLVLARRRRLHLLGVAAAVSSVVLCESRTALVAVGVGLTVMFLRSGMRKGPIAALAGAVAVVGGLVAGGGAVLAQGSLAQALDRFSSTEGGSRLNARETAWRAAYRFWEEQPVGYGWGSTRVVFDERIGQGGFYFTPLSVHNSYLQHLLEVGLVGLLPLLALVVGLVYTALRVRPSGLGLGLAGVVLAGLALQIAESALFGTGQAYPYLYWPVVAAAVMARSDGEDPLPATSKQGEEHPSSAQPFGRRRPGMAGSAQLDPGELLAGQAAGTAR